MKIVFDPTAAHNVYLDVPRCFIVFNDTPDLTMEPVCDSDIREVRWAAGSNRFADCAWSSDCSWYFIIVESATDHVTDQGTEMLHHPALRDIPRIRLPQAWTVCGGPAYVRAARSLVGQIEAN